MTASQSLDQKLICVSAARAIREGKTEQAMELMGQISEEYITGDFERHMAASQRFFDDGMEIAEFVQLVRGQEAAAKQQVLEETVWMHRPGAA